MAVSRWAHAASWFAMIGLHAALAAPSSPSPQDDCDNDAPFRVHHADEGVIEAHGVWLDAHRLIWPGGDGTGRYRLYASAKGDLVVRPGNLVRGAEQKFELTASKSDSVPARFAYLGPGVVLSLRERDARRVDALLRGQLLLVHEGKDGKVIDATGTQIAAALDERYAVARDAADLGAIPRGGATTFALWAPTARGVSLCLDPRDERHQSVALALKRDDASGIWSTRREENLAGHGYLFLVDVYVPGTGWVRQRVTDPYSVSLGVDLQRSYIADLAQKDLAPEGWEKAGPKPADHAVDQVIYELHPRDFSASDTSVPAADRGKYLAFAHRDSNGMRHLRALREAGLTDVHLLPVFDFAGVPDVGCQSGEITGAAPNSEEQQKRAMALAKTDCYTWGYAANHFGAPEGSYASDPADGAVRIREFRQMVMALHDIGLRVGLDVVYNHTYAAGQDAQSVLDRIVPGYYHRLDAKGAVEISTCCANTATENTMTAKLMIDTAVRWVRDYHVDGFRFDLMGHQPRSVMEALQVAVDQAAGHHIAILGEGWNFGEVKDGARFVQASQLSLGGSHLATLSDRLRDAARGGGAMDEGAALVERQGFLNGLGYAPNAATRGVDSAAALRHANDLVRVGLAGTLRDYVMRASDGQDHPLSQIDYSGQPAGYASEPDEAVNYVENHDNPTLFDIDALRLPADTSRDERARVQMLGAALVAFSQGIAYFHAGQDVLRSKSLDRNSNDSGDTFNRLDWSYTDNGFGRGLPPTPDNGKSWDAMRPVLANTSIKPQPAQIAWSRDAFRDLLRIRASTSLLRLRSAADIQQRLHFVNTGEKSEPTVVAAHIDGKDYPDARFAELLYFVNVDLKPHTLSLPEESGKRYVLHPVQRAKTAVDARPRDKARYNPKHGLFVIPPRSAVVYVVE